MLHEANLQSFPLVVKAYAPAVFGTTSARSCNAQTLYLTDAKDIHTAYFGYKKNEIW